jgi:hypothetical protein
MTQDPEPRFTFRKVLKAIFFPLLIMVNPKIYFPFDEDDDPVRKPGPTKGGGDGGEDVEE